MPGERAQVEPWILGSSGGQNAQVAGAIPYPTPAEAAAHPWTDADRALVADRLRPRFAGTAEQVADRLEILRDATAADELIVTTITHDHADRIRSFELLAEEWETR